MSANAIRRIEFAAGPLNGCVSVQIIPPIASVLRASIKRTGRVKIKATTRPFLAFHHVHAQDQHEDSLVDLVAYPDPEVINQFYLDRLRSAETVRATGQLVRFRIGRSGEVQEEALNPEPIELPRMNR